MTTQGKSNRPPGRSKSPAPRDSRINITITARLKRRIRIAARHLGMTESDLGMEAIEAYLIRLEMEADDSIQPRLSEGPIENLRRLRKTPEIPRKRTGSVL